MTVSVLGMIMTTHCMYFQFTTGYTCIDLHVNGYNIAAWRSGYHARARIYSLDHSWNKIWSFIEINKFPLCIFICLNSSEVLCIIWRIHACKSITSVWASFSVKRSQHYNTIKLSEFSVKMAIDWRM